MQKIMIIVAVVTMAFASNAASFIWKTATTGKVYESGTTTTLAAGTAYLFADAGATTQAAIFTALAGGADVTTLGALDSSAISAGAIKTNADPFTYGGDISAYLVVVNDDKFLITGTKDATAPEVGSATISFNVKTESQAAALDAAGGFKGAGWYAAVPEPTSGLLMLVGLAGLALRRGRRA